MTWRIIHHFFNIFCLALFFSSVHAGTQKGVCFDWSTIDVDDPVFLSTLSFPPGFKFGVGDSAFQTEGVQGPAGKVACNNWTEWRKVISGKPFTYNPNNACERWARYKEDIKCIADCGFDLYRTSVEWSKIEPEPSVFDEEAMAHYVDVFDEALQYGLEPVITLFHHTWPAWFDELGAFEKSENIKYFVEFCTYVFQHLHRKVRMWIILNEPAGYAIEGYYRGEYSPGVKNFKRAGVVLNNMLNAHVQTYTALKKIDAEVQIGIAHIFQPLEPYHRWNPLERLACSLFEPLLNDVVLEYFKTGEFSWKLVGKSVRDTNKNAPGTLDFLGINYYSHTVLTSQLSFMKVLVPTKRPCDKVSDDDKIVYPEGLLWAIEKGAQLGIPMYIMENGVADAHDRIRAQYINQHLYITSLAAQKYDIRGYVYWTFMDNFEWNKGYRLKYGLFAVNHQTQERTLRESAKPFITFLQTRKHQPS